MRNRIKPFLILLLYVITVFPQQKTATYKDLSPNIFAKYTQPIGIGILKFEGSSDLHGKLYEELKTKPGIHSKFTIFPYEVLEQQKSVLGINGNITADNIQALKLLKSNLEIELVVSGSYISSSEFVMRICKTSDGHQEFAASYTNSTNSTGIKDVVKLFSENKQTIYEEKQLVPEVMVFVEGGYFNMGSNDGDSDEKPVHRVYLNSFYIDKFEVTQREYEEVMGNNPSYFKCPDCPVENINWYRANDYSQKVGKRLPTDAEWEYAAKGGNKSRGYKYSGSDNLGEVGWYTGNSGSKTHPVGRLKANELGIYDMSGNVWEWCSDWYDGGYYNKSPERNPTGSQNGILKIVRSGSWLNVKIHCNVSNRIGYFPDNSVNDVGFRCVKDVK